MQQINFRRIAIAVLTLAVAVSAAAATDFKALLKSIDELQTFSKQDYSAVYDIVSEKPGENPTTTQVKIFRRDDHDQIVILIQKPEKQKGQGYLKIDDNVWFYDPESGNYSHSTMKENINGSQAKNSDFKKYTFAEDFDIVKTDEGKLGSFETWVLTLQSKNDEVSYQKIRLTVRKDKPIPLKEEDFSVSDRPMRTIYYLPTYVQVNDKLIPAKIKMVDEVNKGTQSVLTISNVYVGKLDNKYFQKTFLESAQ
ncbi:MAG: outer membrane lipoprotein-sorting protein [Rectinemataceae bacterium]|jgi:outer membrane lipoprotein-sorting protein